MRYTAIALDYDGTIAKDGVVPPHVLDGLRRLRESGRKLILVTGRELEELLGIFPEIDVFHRVIAENGALLYRPKTGEKRELGEPPPESLVDALKASGIPLAVGHTILATVRPHETVVLEAIAELGLEQQVIFNKGAVMVLPPGCNKASGLKHALAELGLSARNVVAAGDGENDHALLDMAEYSCATANAIATLKDAADRVTVRTHGDGVLEVIEGIIESDLAALVPKKRRRALCLGQDAEGGDVVLPSRRASLVIAGDPAHTTQLGSALLERLCRTGYQVCVLDTRGDYIDFQSAVVFGSLDNPPTVEEVLTALEKPDVQTVVCLAAVPEEKRTQWVGKLLQPLRLLRAKTGRPHWILVDEVHDLMPASATEGDSPMEGAENTLFATDDPAAISPAILATVDGVAACGEGARAIIESFARALSWEPEGMPERDAREGEAIVWFRTTERPVSLVTLARVKEEPKAEIKPEKREKSPEVGNVLRQA
ncbi:MAG TPA: HAD family hydrolase [Usitatibacter sp.]|nr:HAD family hydrolase [Usitatibacter sp.]